MTKTAELRKIVESKGITYVHIAKELGITYMALLNKIENKREFKASEISRLSKILNLNEKEVVRIFFA